jgi:hypothetical protein
MPEYGLRLLDMIAVYISMHATQSKMAKIAAYYMNADFETSIYALQSKILMNSETTVLKSRISRKFKQTSNTGKTYYQDLVECRDDVCRILDFAVSSKAGVIHWYYVAEDYMVVSFLNPNVILAFNLDVEYYAKESARTQCHDFEIYVLVDVDNDMQDKNSFRKKIHARFVDFISQFFDYTLDAYTIPGPTMPSPRTRQRYT